MKFGTLLFIDGDSMSPARLGQAAEERGFESVWLAEHSHVPVAQKTPFPFGGKAPEYHHRMADPYIALTAIAAATEHLLLGTGISLVLQRHPITLAKEIATLDRISGGRFLLGAGMGWNHEEAGNHGLGRQRAEMLKEHVQAMRRIWGAETASHHGRHFDFDPIYSWPKPVQRNGPPVLLGMNGPLAVDRVLNYGDGWAPVPGLCPGLPEKVRDLQRSAAERGRARIPVTLLSVEPEQMAIEPFLEWDVDRIVLFEEPPPATTDQVMWQLDRMAAVVAKTT